jgi:bifunctional UDP-N-acetylglucosamine pyrophosphorylase / glucosamine-1-phosphate N-acetyltransferase
MGNINIVVLAAGQGKRMMSSIPKVLHPLAGVPMVLRVLSAAQALNPAKIVVVIGHGGEAVKAALPAGTLTAVQTEQKGTGHAVAQALPLLDTSLPTLVLCGDVPCINLRDLQALLLKAGDHMGVLTAKPNDPTGYGRMVMSPSGLVERVIEHKDCTPEQQHSLLEINTGVIILPAHKAATWLSAITPNNAQGEYYLPDCIGFANAEGVPVAAVQASKAWQTEGVNSRAQLVGLERLFQLDLAEQLMAQGVALADPARIDIRGTLHCEQDASIDVNCVFEGAVYIATGAVIGANCVLKNCSIAAGAQILPFSHIDGATVGAGSRIGPYARLRPGTTLENDCHVGNFVELKNTQVAAHSKVNHLAYIGDATVGSQVNIGAGVITCNYDGANKFRTIIEDRAFVGSDVQLMAPVTVGAGATIGAGTTLTKNAPPEQLTVSRVKQVTIEGWKRPVKKSK